ncbi:hypothetical protein [Marivita hallyeonensis]|uniref:Uncharacterized protein n=1 Tax=Marivita hallyeonensis TaxID=996342 RepID=A0A1M5MN76_9RHOB|nr:hypothetical protein [Marivita hallyeonensis]SHG78884.1 hypothetical protein SAMN05443551_0587 [Marivita hallyeonensis]
MEITQLIVVLFLGTISAVLIFALVSKWRVEKRMADDSAPKSTLAADAPSTR